ncbi:ABC-F family ATP-binding cassette domain-containing protein [Hymenobacter negativus]|uniref:ABC-F family ATP-binding cassette domain-containing protein n=1 Tax=Hymenobacter negativus TaxID=2795026 RepID=A0ABS0Q1H2_9BACT|nr:MULTISPECIES: ABC-F family ATP-binding cassette domain-containing protein [Bacteria]MBH8556501.1 ABC-F family ATP-binding cassette domain-containing protein [Hymenobacter negativus]MBH8571022.1 ABC-F family ATP-binding cassette domain-containing protein [Hymenobacter negativus]MBR7210759.1 ABC-F family ATP-binding cassette domain-containing protein [Microvirga sp. STS02]
MISISDLDFHFGSRTLYDNASLHIKPKDKIGLIGLNGTGKSTLLRLLVGEYKADGGSISMSKEVTLGFLNQDLLSYDTHESILHVAMQAFEEALELQKKIDEILVLFETDYSDDLVDKLATMQERFEALGGYTMQARAEEILEGLGFSTEDLQKPLKSFSGGWRMRVMLAKILLQQPSLLLLDEPTNHLDLPSIKWIENYLADYEGAVIIVSHDRAFLDRTTNTTVEVLGGKLVPYAGNYSYYLEEKEERNLIQKGAFENQQAQIRQAERFIERFKAKASKAKQAQSRVKALDKLERIEDVAQDAAKINMKFTFKVEPGRHILRMEHVTKKYDQKLIFRDTNVHIERGDKIALIGANGKGKSTLMRLVAGTEAPTAGKHQLGHNVIMSFYAQHQLESLTLDNEILQEMSEAGSKRNDMELRSVLGSFLFTGDEVFKKIKVLSGGEKSRVALAKTLISEANFLLLDEPTNHLDMVSVNILIQALEQYEGTFIVISHDRYFVENVATKIWFIEDYQLKEYPGTYEEYERWQDDREKAAKKAGLPSPSANKPQPKEEKKADPMPAKTSSPDQKKALKELAEVEAKIDVLEKELAGYEKQLADPKIYENAAQLKDATVKFEQVKKELAQLNDRWEMLAEV